MKICSVCGKKITEGYVWDGTECFCSEECLTSRFYDKAAVPILIEEGERVVWEQFGDSEIVWSDEFNALLQLLTDDEKQLLADTINHGGWGNCDMSFINKDGEVVGADCWGYITNRAKDAGHFNGRKVSAMFRSIYRKIENKRPDSWYKGTGAGEITCHFNNWWGDGSGDVLFIRKPFCDEAEQWAKNYTYENNK